MAVTETPTANVAVEPAYISGRQDDVPGYYTDEELRRNRRRSNASARTDRNANQQRNLRGQDRAAANVEAYSDEAERQFAAKEERLAAQNAEGLENASAHLGDKVTLNGAAPQTIKGVETAPGPMIPIKQPEPPLPADLPFKPVHPDVINPSHTPQPTVELPLTEPRPEIPAPPPISTKGPTPTAVAEAAPVPAPAVTPAPAEAGVVAASAPLEIEAVAHPTAMPHHPKNGYVAPGQERHAKQKRTTVTRHEERQAKLAERTPPREARSSTASVAEEGLPPQPVDTQWPPEGVQPLDNAPKETAAPAAAPPPAEVPKVPPAPTTEEKVVETAKKIALVDKVKTSFATSATWGKGVKTAGAIVGGGAMLHGAYGAIANSSVTDEQGNKQRSWSKTLGYGVEAAAGAAVTWLSLFKQLGVAAAKVIR